MGKNYIKSQSKSGEFSPRINKEVNRYLDIYCETNRINKTQYVNKVLMQDMIDKFQALKN